MITVIASGGFDPLHIGHVEYLEKARMEGTSLTVLLNSDEWLVRKKGFAFMRWEERAAVLRSLRCVDRVVMAEDDDGTVCRSLRRYGSGCIFAKGGDRGADNTPEAALCAELGINVVYGLGDKVQSSSDLVAIAASNAGQPLPVRAASAPVTHRPWGSFQVLAQGADWKLKRLDIRAGCRTSLQCHMHRTEEMQVVDGGVSLQIGLEEPKMAMLREKVYTVHPGRWHRLKAYGTDATIIELQRGVCDEADIIRAADDYGRAD